MPAEQDRYLVQPPRQSHKGRAASHRSQHLVALRRSLAMLGVLLICDDAHNTTTKATGSGLRLVSFWRHYPNVARAPHNPGF